MNEARASRSVRLARRLWPRHNELARPTDWIEAALRARWPAPDGHTRVGRVEAEDGLRAGAEVPIWLIRWTGHCTRRRHRGGFTVAITTWTAGTALLALVYFAARAALNRSRYAAWRGWGTFTRGRTRRS